MKKKWESELEMGPIATAVGMVVALVMVVWWAVISGVLGALFLLFAFLIIGALVTAFFGS